MDTHGQHSRRAEAELADLGFGERVVREPSIRLLNRDGTFNVSREGLSFIKSLHVYQTLIAASWWRFNFLLVGAYAALIAVFALLYLACGRDAIVSAGAASPTGRLADAFNFSVQTITSVGYGHLIPNGLAANVLVAVESFLGLSGIAVAAALIYARVSRPTTKIIFSNDAVVSREGQTPQFKFRVINGARNELIDLHARLLVAKTKMVGGFRTRRVHELPLARNRVAFFPMDWMVVHDIDENSPLHGMTPEQMEEGRAEFLVLINGVDATLSQHVYARSSYRWDEVKWNMRFADMFRRKVDGRIAIDLGRLHALEPAGPRITGSETIWDF